MKPFRFFHRDLLGISVSVLCTLHCVALPLVLSSFSVLGTAWLHNTWLEAGLIILAFVFGWMAFYKTRAVQPKRKWPLLLFSAGFCLLLANQWQEGYTLILIPLASVAIIAAHLTNYRHCKKSKACVLKPEV